MQRMYKWVEPLYSVMLEESKQPNELILTLTVVEETCHPSVSVVISKKIWEEMWEVTRDRSYGDKFSWTGQLSKEPKEQITEMEPFTPPTDISPTSL